MPKTLEAARRRDYDRGAYATFLVRVRRGSELAALMRDYQYTGEHTLNFLITKLLCAHFGVGLPCKKYFIFKRKNIYSKGEGDG